MLHLNTKDEIIKEILRINELLENSDGLNLSEFQQAAFAEERDLYRTQLQDLEDRNESTLRQIPGTVY